MMHGGSGMHSSLRPKMGGQGVTNAQECLESNARLPIGCSASFFRCPRRRSACAGVRMGATLFGMDRAVLHAMHTVELMFPAAMCQTCKFHYTKCLTLLLDGTLRLQHTFPKHFVILTLFDLWYETLELYKVPNHTQSSSILNINASHTKLHFVHEHTNVCLKSK